jgi:hypothetical protein
MRKIILGVSALALMAGGPAVANDLFVEQIGTSNFADGSQTGVNNEGYVRQDGNYNSAGAGFKGNNNDGLVLQTTNRNRADWSFEAASQGGISGNTFGVIQGGGNENFASLNTQGAPTNSTWFVEQIEGSSNEVGGGNNYTTPVGNGNTSGIQITTTGMTSGIGPSDISFFDPVDNGSNLARMEGNNNYVGLRQLGSNNVAAVNVNGNNNRIGGPDTTRNSATLNDFTHTDFFSSPDTLGPASGAGVTGMGVQDGVGNEVALVQAGDDNSINFAQVGNDQTAEFYQSGYGNLAVGIQTQ